MAGGFLLEQPNVLQVSNPGPTVLLPNALLMRHDLVSKIGKFTSRVSSIVFGRSPPVIRVNLFTCHRTVTIEDTSVTPFSSCKITTEFDVSVL